MEKLKLDVVDASAIDSQTFVSSYLTRSQPLLVTDVFSSPPLSEAAQLKDFRLLLEHSEVRDLQAEMALHRGGDILRPEDFPDPMSALDASRLFQRRMDPTSRIDPVQPRRELVMDSSLSLYAKVSLTQCPALMDQLKVSTFLAPQGSEMLPADHPMLLRPGRYFCWAFVGEKDSGSRPHVDVMGSEAWLTVLSGKKLWAIVHPHDKHLVMDSSGSFLDLFNLDLDKFPQARRARMVTFVQEAGMAVYVPSDAPHAVRNLEFSSSVTFNFMWSPHSDDVWKLMVQRVVSPNAVGGILDAVCSQKRELLDPSDNDGGKTAVVLRAFLGNWPETPNTSFVLRCVLTEVQDSFVGSCPGIDKLRTAGVPVGCDVSPCGHRLIVFFELTATSFSDLVRLVQSNTPTASAIVETRTTASLRPALPFRSLSSHYGPIPEFPPLSVLLRQSWYFDRAFSYAPLISTIKARRQLPFSDVGASSLWHYSRFPWIAPADPSSEKLWSCRTFLFYSSSDLEGPVSIHPLTTDKTLQRHPVCSVTHQDELPFQPHFEEFRWNLDALEPFAIVAATIDLRDSVVKTITSAVVLHKEYMNFCNFAGDHGMNAVDLMECGIEKVMALVLYFSARPGVVGFTYSHVFTNVHEPNTLCLEGTCATAILNRASNSPFAEAVTALCNWIVEKGDGEDDLQKIFNTLSGKVPNKSELRSYQRWLLNVLQWKSNEAVTECDEGSGFALKKRVSLAIGCVASLLS
jgi:hypothetical protein